MIDRDKFDLIKEKYGHYASWAVWADGIDKPKENVGDLSLFEATEHYALLKQLNPNVVLVGLNISRRIQSALGNFHDGRPSSMDYKIPRIRSHPRLKAFVQHSSNLKPTTKRFLRPESHTRRNCFRSSSHFVNDQGPPVLPPR
jgi:hypothetical protein